MPQTEDAQFYQLYFQAPGVAEAELERPVPHSSLLLARVGEKLHGWTESPRCSLALTGNTLRFNLHASFEVRGIVLGAPCAAHLKKDLLCSEWNVVGSVLQKSLPVADGAR